MTSRTGFVRASLAMTVSTKIIFNNSNNSLSLVSCINNCMSNNQFKKGELYSFITGKASTAIGRRLQKNFKQSNVEITIEQWSVLYHLWKEDRRKNLIILTPIGKELEERCMEIANVSLNEALVGVTHGQIEIAKEVLQMVYD